MRSPLRGGLPRSLGPLAEGPGELTGLSGPVDRVVEFRPGNGLLDGALDRTRPVGLLPTGVAAVECVGAGVKLRSAFPALQS